MANSKVALDVNDIPNSARAWSGALQDAAGLKVPDALSRPLYNTLEALAQAGAGIVQAQSDAATMEQNTMLDWQYRLTKGRTGFLAALDAADSALSAARAAKDTARDKLRALALPKAPAGAGDAMQALAAQEVIKYLEPSVTGGNEAILRERVAELLTDALHNDDQAAAAVLFSLPLRMFYTRVGVSLTPLYQRMQRVQRDVTGNDTEIPGLVLLATLEGGEFPAFLDSVGIVLWRTRQDVEERYQQIARTYPLQGRR
jgi:hypothetical protein